jgi:hypothetical protein
LRLPQRTAREFTFEDFPDRLRGAQPGQPAPAVTPGRTFAGDDLTRKRAAEEESLYRRWEWFTQPRVYPTGRWDNEKVRTELQRVESVDGDLLGRAEAAAPKGALL